MIITIIVLVILAAVSINAAFNTGIIDTAINGTVNYAVAGRQEQVTFDELDSNLQGILKRIEEDDIGGIVPTERPTEPTPTEKPVPTLPPIGTTPPTEGWTVEAAKELVKRDGLKVHLGEKVDYNPAGGGTWRIFYYDNEDQGNGKGYFGDDIGTVYLKRDFVTHDINLSKYTNHNPTDGGEIMRQMNPKWSNSSYSKIDTINERCMSGLCDPEEWTNYKVEGVAKYAIGDPSVEMYMKAFNIYKEDNTALVNKIGDEGGYLVGANGIYANNGRYTDENTIEPGPNNIFMAPGSIWIWLASPRTGCGTDMFSIPSSTAKIDFSNYANANGACSIVALL